jgi:hypothetical protein
MTTQSTKKINGTSFLGNLGRIRVRIRKAMRATNIQSNPDIDRLVPPTSTDMTPPMPAVAEVRMMKFRKKFGFRTEKNDISRSSALETK